MKYGVVYRKDPFECIAFLDEAPDPAETYIVLHHINMRKWKKVLENKEIDPDKVDGISLAELSYFGALVPQPVDPFLKSEIVWILVKKFRNPTEDLSELIGIIRKRKCSTPDIMKFHYQVNVLMEEVTKNIR
jgi:hypothetical protein